MSLGLSQPSVDTSERAKVRVALGTSARTRGLIAAAVLGLATFAGHGWSLFDGLALDDHWHYHTVREADWTPSDLLTATTIDTEELLHTWWQEKPVRFQYSRPVAVALMKLTYALTGDSVVAQHVLNLGLHFAAGMLVYALCLRITRRHSWAVGGGLLFVLYPHSLFAVSWLASQNMLLQTVLTLGALLFYIRASGLDLSLQSARDARTIPPLQPGSFVLFLLLWIAALFSRENAMMLPVIVVAFDLAYGGRRHVWARRWAYAAIATIGVGFLVWRFGFFYEPMPDVYVRRPEGEGYLLWCLAKLLHYVCCSVWLAPMAVGPTGRFEPFADVPADCALMFGIVAAVGLVYFLAARKARGWWIWPLWLVLAIVPVIPVLATPHSAYLPGVAVGVGLAMAAAAPQRQRSILRRWPAALAVVVLAAGAAYLKVNRLMWMGMVEAERCTRISLAADPPDEAVTDAFFINLPFAGIYAKMYAAEDIGPRAYDIAWHVLTYAPELTRMAADCTLEQVDAHTFNVRVQDDPYFSHLLGRFLIDGFRESGPFVAGQRIAADKFDVLIRSADARGVRELQFRFEEPLASKRYRFYLTSFESGATAINFKPPGWKPNELPPLPEPPVTPIEPQAHWKDFASGAERTEDIVFAALRSQDAETRDSAERIVRHFVPIMAKVWAAPAPDVLASADLRPHVDELRNWWHFHADRDALMAYARVRPRFVVMRHRRDELARARAFAARFIRSDLYLTGPPFPGPRRPEAHDPAGERILHARQIRSDAPRNR